MAEPSIEKYQYKDQSSVTIISEQTILHVMQHKTKNGFAFRWRSEKEDVEKQDEYTFYIYF